MDNREKRPPRTAEKAPVWDVETVASATECTGLAPAAVQTPEEAGQYAQLYAIHEQKTAWEREAGGKPAPRKKSE